MQKNKKAVSQIVTTILIILLVLAAIVIVWQAVKGTVEQGAGTITAKSSCIGATLELENIACAATGQAITGNVKRGADSITTMKMKIVIGNTAGAAITAPGSLGTLPLTGTGSVGSNIVKVAPIVVASDGTDIVCDPTDQFTVTCP